MNRLPTFVYIVQSRIGTIKIGCTTNPKARAEIISAHSAAPVRLIAFWPGKRRDELDLHNRFVEFCSHNEWFADVGPVASFVKKNWARGPVVVRDWPHVMHEGTVARRATGYLARSATLKAKWANPEYKAEMSAWMAKMRQRKRFAPAPVEAERLAS